MTTIIITTNEWQQINNCLHQFNRANDVVDEAPNRVTVEDTQTLKNITKMLVTGFNGAYESGRTFEIKTIITMVKQGYEIKYYERFITIGTKTFNGYTKELIEKILAN